MNKTPGEDLDESARVVGEIVEHALRFLYRGAPPAFRKPEVIIVLARDGEVGCGTTVRS